MDGIQPLKLQSAFFRDWGRYWNREDEIDPHAHEMLQSVPDEWKTLSQDTRIQLTDLKQAIRQTKTTTSPGCCGWTQPDLMCVPDCLLDKLIQLWNEFLDGWKISMAPKPPFRKNCHPQENSNYFEYDGCSAYHNFVTSLSSSVQNLD